MIQLNYLVVGTYWATFVFGHKIQFTEKDNEALLTASFGVAS